MQKEVLKMDTKRIHVNESSYKEEVFKLGKILREGGLVAFPTETVDGLGGNALDADAAKKIYAAKGRPSDNPLIVHITRREALGRIVTEVPEAAERLMDAFGRVL